MIHLKLYNSRCPKKEYIESVIEICKQILNETLGENFFKDNNLKVAFCNSKNGAAVYEEFCEQFFPLYLGEGYSSTTLFTAQAFTNEQDGIYGILVCLDTGPESDEWYQIILHEMSHIFCITHEIGGENFSTKYSEANMGSKPKYWNVNIGYAVWREFIADYIASRINPLMCPIALTELRETVRELDEGINKDNFHRTQDVSKLLWYIFLYPKCHAAMDVATIFRFLEKNRVFATKARSRLYQEIIALIFEQLQRESYWEISLQFIEKLGMAYLLLVIV